MASTSTERGGVRPGRLVVLVLGTIVALVAIAVLIGTGALAWLYFAERDDDGFFMSPAGEYETTGYALRSEEVDFGTAEGPDWLEDLATVRLTARPAGEADEVFIGIASEDDVTAYLSDVEHAMVTDVEFDPFAAEYRPREGGAPDTPPGQLDIWVASAAGTGTQALEWDIDEGEWAAVVMNSDASQGVTAEMTAGIRVDALGGFIIGLLVVGLLLLAGGVALILIGGTRLFRPRTGAAGGGTEPPP